MIKYRLSVGKMLSTSRGQVKKGKPPVCTISCLYVSEIYDDIEEVRHAADTLVALSPLHLGFTLEAYSWFKERQYTFNASSESAFYYLGSGISYNREYLILELINGPAFFGVMTEEKEYREYVSVNNAYKSKLFAEYRPYIDLETLKHKYEVATQFTVRGITTVSPCITCYTQQETIYEERK